VSINGVVQIPTTAYSVSSTTLTFTEAPQPGDVIDVRILTTTTTVGSIASGNSSVTATGTTVDIQGNLNPTTNLTYTLGNATNQWSSLYVGGNTIYLGNLQLKEASANTFAVYTSDGVTEANIQVGNIDVTSIQSGTSSIAIAAPNGNAVLTAGGNATLTVTPTGANVTGTLNATGVITGNASGLTSIPGANVTGTVGSATTAGTVTTAAQPNITSVGTLSSLSVTGNVTGGGITLSGNTISSTGATLTLDPSAAGATGLVVIAGNLQVQGTTTTIDSTTITTNDLVINMANNAGTSSAANGGGIEVGPVGASYASWTYDQPNSRWNTALGINASGNVTAGNLSVGTGTITVNNIVNGGANGVGNIGSSTTYFNTVFAKATSAQYADLAEKYVADAAYAPGTVVVFGGDKEVTVSSADADRAVAGVVSTNPSYIMNGTLEAEFVATVALTGRVPCRVTGTVRKGDLMVSAGYGLARAEQDPKVGTVIGKALENFEGNEGVIEVVVGRF
jgi:hypothetical protein